MIRSTITSILLIFILVVFVNSCSTKDEIVNYELTTSVQPQEGGRVTPSKGSFPSDTELKITATSKAGFVFKNWSGASTDTTNIIVLHMDSTKQLTATFEKLDSDGDGVTDDHDECSDTPAGETANEQGCSTSQMDTDGDGVTDDHDECSDTPAGETANEQGCSTSQMDTDGDGVSDDKDQCNATESGQSVDENGCSLSQLDTEAPIVTDLLVTEITTNSFKVDWNLNENSKGYIQFGITSGIYSASTENEEILLDRHVQTLGGVNPLEHNTTYYWRIYMEDQYGNTGFSEEYSTTTLAEVLKTYVPDNNFEQNLINNGYDDFLDDYVLTESIQTINFLELGYVTDFTGIEDFTSLENLWISGNLNVIELNLSQNVLLKKLTLSSVSIAELNLNSNTLLEELELLGVATLNSFQLADNVLLERLFIDECEDFVSFDFLQNIAFKYLGLKSENPNVHNLNLGNNIDLSSLFITIPSLSNLELSSNLITIYVWSSSLSSLDLSQNLNLNELLLYSDALTSLDMSQNLSLNRLTVGYNDIASLNLTNNVDLSELRLYSLPMISGLDLSQNVDLRVIQLIQINSLTSLDLSNNSGLEEIMITNNDIINQVNIKTGDNSIPYSIRFISNPNLFCVEVDNATYSTANWSQYLDSWTSYSEDCGY